MLNVMLSPMISFVNHGTDEFTKESYGLPIFMVMHSPMTLWYIMVLTLRTSYVQGNAQSYDSLVNHGTPLSSHHLLNEQVGVI